MFRFFRKHRWLLILCLAIVAVTFVFFMGQGGNRGNGSGVIADYGTIYGHKVTQQEYNNARNQFDLFYFFRNGELPNNSTLRPNELDTEIYVNIMLDRKAQDLGINVNDDAAAKSAASLLQSLDRNGQHVTLDALDKSVLQPAGLTIDDFERLARRDVMVRQLIQVLGISGALVTPQEAQNLYEREHEKIQAQAVFISATNYMTSVAITPDVLGQFYTNELAYYRLPERVQVNYVEFNASNYLAGAEQKLGKTNLDMAVAQQFRQYGMDAVPGAKTPDEAKAKMREGFIRQEARRLALNDANDFATQAESQTPVRPENLAALAKQKGLSVRTTQPFNSQYGPEEFLASEAFVRAAFALTADEPIAGPLDCGAAFYVVALDKKLPSEIPSLDSIHDRVVNDYKRMMAMQIVQRVGTNFVQQLNAKLAVGKSFVVAADTAGFQPEALTPFSLDTQELPELHDRADIRQVKQAAFTTPVEHASDFEPTQDGGFVLFVEKKLPVNAATMNAEMPEFVAQLRQGRESDAFNAWIQSEANREFANVPAFKKEAAAAGAK